MEIILVNDARAKCWTVTLPDGRTLPLPLTNQSTRQHALYHVQRLFPHVGLSVTFNWGE